MRTFAAVLLLAGFWLLSSIRANSQTGSEATRAPDGGIRQRVDGIFIPAVPGAPFSAKVDVEVTRLLPDGTTVAQKYYTRVARDSQGRLHRERRDLLPAGSDREPRLAEINLYDTAEKTRTTCVMARHTCTIENYRPVLGVAEVPAGMSRNGQWYLTRENLGNETLDDLDALHTRETQTINPGVFGNDHAVAVTKEFWYSGQLQINLAVTRHDPRTGDQRLKVTELSLSEPDPSWFTPPEGFRMVDNRRHTSPIRPSEQ